VTFIDIFQDSFRSLGSHFAGAVTNTAGLILKFFVALIALYYFIKDGRQFLDELIKLSPLEDSEDVAIVHRLDKVTHSLIRGTLVIAALQGLFVGLGFTLFGVPNPVLWGAIAAIGALIPMVGTGMVTAPAIIYLFLTGNVAAGIGLLAWSMLLVGLVDNIIGPKLIGNGARIHPLLVLLAVLGGIALFGISGFLLGPLLLGFLMALSEIYKVKVQELHKQA
jgi:predicted PurR-regulated permease PerM